MSELSPDAKALVERARLEDGPRAEDKQRVRERLAAQLGAAAFASVVLGSAAVSAPTGKAALLKAGLLKSSALRWLTGTLAAGSVAVGGYLLAAPPSATAPAASAPAERRVEPAFGEPPGGADALGANTGGANAGGEAAGRAPSGSANAGGANAASAKEGGANAGGVHVGGANDLAAPAAGRSAKVTPPAERRRARKRAPAPAFAPIGDSGSMSAEIALLSRAQQALRARDGKEALRFVRQHAESFPHGALYEERVGIEAIAHCVLGERDHPAVRAFLARAPRSPLSARVKKECGVP